MEYFVTSDIHGFYDEFIKSLNKQGFDKNNPNHKIIICGDIFDRGYQPQQLINFILGNKDKIIYIRGNHEDMMQEMINRNANTVYDLQNGTAGTMIDLCPEWHITRFDLKEIAKETRLQEVLDLTINYYETNKYVFVHGWIPTIDDDYMYDNNWRNASNKAWYDSRWAKSIEMYKNKIFEPNKTIVCGHWHCSAFWQETNPESFTEFGKNANFEPFITKEVIALDACTVRSHRVNVIKLEDF